MSVESNRPAVSEGKHTPGPWMQFGARYVWKTGEAGGAVCIIAEPECADSTCFKRVEIDSPRFDEAMANARLIAAAPLLLEALEELLTASECADETGYIEGEGFIDLDVIHAKANIALVAAKGDA